MGLFVESVCDSRREYAADLWVSHIVPLGCANQVVAVTGTGAQSGADAVPLAVAVAHGLAHRVAHMDQMRLANGCD